MNLFKTNCILLSTVFLWASAFIGIKIGLLGYSPGSLALLRFLAASFTIALVYLNKGITKNIPWIDKILLIISGMAGIGLYNICLNYGEITVSAGVASFVIGLMPIITILLSVVFLKEKQSVGIWIGVLISLAGLAVLAGWEGYHDNMATGIALILVSAITGAILTIVQRAYAKRYHPVAIITWIIWGGTLLLMIFLPTLLKEIQFAPQKSTWAALYMGIFPGAFAYFAWGLVLENVSASKASVSLYALPIMSTLMGFTFLHEQPSFISLLGGGIALGGAFIANHHQQAKSAKYIDNSVATTV